MPNNENRDIRKEARDIMERARAAHAEEKQRKAASEADKVLARRRRNRFITESVRRSCVLYTVFCILHFLAYVAIVFPQTGKPFSEMMLGGLSVYGHFVFYCGALAASVVYGIVTYKQEPSERTPATAFLFRVSARFLCLQLLLIILYGLYLDMMYNPYNVTEAGLFRGPSFLLAASCLGFSVCLGFVNRIYGVKRLPLILRIVFHLAITMILSTVFFYLIASGFSSASDLLIFLFVFALLYVLFCAAYYAIRLAKERDDNENEAYENLYMTDALRREHAEQTAREEKKRRDREAKFRK